MEVCKKCQKEVLEVFDGEGDYGYCEECYSRHVFFCNGCERDLPKSKKENDYTRSYLAGYKDGCYPYCNECY